MTENKNDVHVMPVFEGEPDHEDSSKCWCDPELHHIDETTGNHVWTHRRPQ